MLSLCLHAADGRWDLLSPPEQLRLAHHALCTSLYTCGLPRMFITKGASRVASLCNGCLKMHLLIGFIVYVAESVCGSCMVYVQSKSAHVHTEERDVLVTWKGVGCVRLHICALYVCACVPAPTVTRRVMALSTEERVFRIVTGDGHERKILHMKVYLPTWASPWAYSIPLCTSVFGFVLKIFKIVWRAYWPKAWSFEMRCLTLPPAIGQ